MSDPQVVKAMGIFIDSTMTVNGNIPKAMTVGRAVGRMLPDLANKVNQAFDLDPPLDVTKMHTVHFPSRESLFILAVSSFLVC